MAARARQNVIFEHGLLMGLLGRERVCAVVEGDVELPSDVHGLIYERLAEADTDTLRIARILTQSGYEVDASLLI